MSMRSEEVTIKGSEPCFSLSNSSSSSNLRGNACRVSECPQRCTQSS